MVLLQLVCVLGLPNKFATVTTGPPYGTARRIWRRRLQIHRGHTRLHSVRTENGEHRRSPSFHSQSDLQGTTCPILSVHFLSPLPRKTQFFIFATLEPTSCRFFPTLEPTIRITCRSALNYCTSIVHKFPRSFAYVYDTPSKYVVLRRPGPSREFLYNQSTLVDLIYSQVLIRASHH